VASRRGNPRAALDVSLGEKYWFNDFGAYRQADLAGVEQAKARILASARPPAEAPRVVC